MNTTIRSAILALSMILMGSMAGAGVLGTWASAPSEEGRRIHVRIAHCAAPHQDKMCGVITRVLDAAGKSISTARAKGMIGKVMLWGMTPDGPSSWDNGKIWAPDKDKVYDAEMALQGGKLKVSGCVLIICRSQTWSRVK